MKLLIIETYFTLVTRSVSKNHNALISHSNQSQSDNPPAPNYKNKNGEKIIRFCYEAQVRENMF
jgi:hypothetical protein